MQEEAAKTSELNENPKDQMQQDADKCRKQNLDDQKQVEFYSAVVNAWITTSMELDKSLLTLASGAIAFSMTLITPLKNSDLMMFFYFLGNASFVITVAATLAAFSLNKGNIERLINSGSSGGRALVWVDRAAISSFILGVVCLFTVGAYNVVQSDKAKEKEVAENGKQIVEIQKSLNKLENLAISQNESLQNLAKLFPGQEAQNTQTSPKGGQAVSGTLDALKPKPSE